MYGSSNWNPIKSIKDSDNILKLMQWQSKAKTRRHGQHQLCRFCSQSIGVWGHYTTFAMHPVKLGDIEHQLVLASGTKLSNTLYDPDCKQWIAVLSDDLNPQELRIAVNTSL